MDRPYTKADFKADRFDADRKDGLLDAWGRFVVIQNDEMSEREKQLYRDMQKGGV
jgi:hypothetical protein